MRTAKGNCRGFTIIELLIVVAVGAVFAVVAMPNLTGFLREMRASSNASQLYSDLLLARSESIRRNSRMLVCPRADSTSTACATAITAATWMNGWLVCYDIDANGACDATTAGDPNPVRVRGALSTPLSINGPAALVTFFPVGNANAAATFTLTGGSGTHTRVTTVAPSGAVATTKS